MRKWSNIVSNGNGTPEEPPGVIIAELAEWREERRIRQRQVQAKRKESETSSDKLFDRVLKMQLLHLTNQTTWNTPNPPMVTQSPPHLPPQLPYPPITPSSPIHSTTDSSEVLRQFFEWYIEVHAPQQKEELLNICEYLVGEDWGIDDIRAVHNGGSLLEATWQGYGFKLGTLAKLRGKISVFKQ